MATLAFKEIFRCLLSVTLIVAKIRAAQDVFSHEAELDTQGNVFLSWSIKQDVITMELVVKALGYVAVGFSPSGGMKGADIALAWVKDDQVYFKDMYAEGVMAPTEDPSQDYELIHASQNDTHTKVAFRRNMITCDTERDLPFSADTLRVIWAYSEVDNVVYHGPVTRGSRSLYLMSAVQSPWQDKNIGDYKVWDVNVSNVTVPAFSSTVYWCKLFKIPNITTKHQIVGFAPEVTKGNEGYVHHFLFYQCVHPKGLQDEAFGQYTEQEGHVCYGPNMPDAYNLCRITLIAWAIGGQGEMYPEIVGAPMGGEYGGFDYYMLEVHYDNPLKTQGIVDSSGMKIFYTNKLRQYDSGTIEFGHPVVELQVIPPGQSSFTTVVSCDQSCTREAIPTEGIKVFQILLHGHTFAYSIKVRHFRDGKELEPLAEDNHYDNDYQQTRAIKPERVILPGDSFQTECIYKTEGRQEPVFGGLSTLEEMCLAYVSYYPKIALGKCKSYPSPDDVAAVVGAEFDPGLEWSKLFFQMGLFPAIHTIKLSGESNNITLPDYMAEKVDWSPEIVSRIQSAVIDNKHFVLCVSETNHNMMQEYAMADLPSTAIGVYEEYGTNLKTPENCNMNMKKTMTTEKQMTPLKSVLLKKFGIRYQG